MLLRGIYHCSGLMNKFWQGSDWGSHLNLNFRLTDQNCGSQCLDNSDPQCPYSTKQPARMSYKDHRYWSQTGLDSNSNLSKCILMPPFDKYMLCIYYVLDMVLDAGSIVINKTDKIENCEPRRNFRDILSLIGIHSCPFAYILSLTVLKQEG